MRTVTPTELRANIYNIAADQRLSHSIIWQIQRQYFLRNGLKAWQEDVVPHQISSSPLMARAYGQIVLGYLRDCLAAAQKGDFQLNPDQPVYIVELGAGSGRLANHFLHQFQPLLAQSPLADLSFKYVLTDFVPELVSFWQEQERFKPWFDSGLLDVALFDVADMRPLRLQQTPFTLTPDQVQNPVILVANYFFDSIPQDSFVIEDGQLSHNLLSLYSSRPEPDLADPAIWDRLKLAFEAIPLAEPAYEEESYNRILAAYEAYLPDTTITFPNTGLDCVRFWQRYGHGRLLLLTSDRGFTLPESLLGRGNPLPNLHGSFSLMVNYHAIGQFVELEKGLNRHAGHYQDNLQTAVYLLGQLPQNGLETRSAFKNVIEQGGPDDFFALKQALEPHLDSLTLPQILSYLRLTAFDGDIFRDSFPTLIKQVQRADPVWFEDVAAVVRQVWQQYLPLSDEDDLVHLIEELFEAMGLEATVISTGGGNLWQNGP